MCVFFGVCVVFLGEGRGVLLKTCPDSSPAVMVLGWFPGLGIRGTEM